MLAGIGLFLTLLPGVLTSDPNLEVVLSWRDPSTGCNAIYERGMKLRMKRREIHIQERHNHFAPRYAMSLLDGALIFQVIC